MINNCLTAKEFEAVKYPIQSSHTVGKYGKSR